MDSMHSLERKKSLATRLIYALPDSSVSLFNCSEFPLSIFKPCD